MPKLPKNIEQDLNINSAFNMFGLVNISSLRSRTGTRLKTDDLINRIKEHFCKEMVNEQIEFIGKEK